MRSVPHRVVCLLGLDDGVFPRKAPRDGDDLAAVPIERPFGWGAIEIVDRLGESNAFLGFGGLLRAWRTDDGSVVAHFTSAAPILRRGGHSQRYDTIAAEIGAFFGRLALRLGL